MVSLSSGHAILCVCVQLSFLEACYFSYLKLNLKVCGEDLRIE